jgi:hypothetical protein
VQTAAALLVQSWSMRGAQSKRGYGVSRAVSQSRAQRSTSSGEADQAKTEQEGGVGFGDKRHIIE